MRCLTSENIRHADFPMNSHDAMNVAVCNGGELLYECSGVATGSSRIRFSYQARTCLDSEFVANCRNVQYCFGCVGLENKKYCILNQQYTEEEYFKKVDEIKTAMLASGEYGEFFPLSMSPYAYNGSLAGIVFSLTKEAVQEKDAFWHEEALQNVAGLNAVNIADLPIDTRDLPPDILRKAIVGTSGKAFRMIPAELDFYKNEHQAVPETHPYERMVSRFAKLNNFQITKAKCASCRSETDSMYPPEAGFTIYCETCFTKEIA